MEITIKMDNGMMDLAGLFSGMIQGGMQRIPLEEEKREEVEMEDMSSSCKIKDIRHRTCLSQAAFASKYRIPKRTIEDWEAGRRKPQDYVVDLLERAVKHDEEIEEIQRECDQKIVDVATGKKKVKFRGGNGIR